MIATEICLMKEGGLIGRRLDKMKIGKLKIYIIYMIHCKITFLNYIHVVRHFLPCSDININNF